MANIDELKLDLQELRDLRSRSTRPRVQDVLDLQIRRLETDLAASDNSGDGAAAKPAKPAAAQSDDSGRVFTREIKTYAWDQSDKYFKLYISDGLSGVGSLDKDRVSTEFTESSARLRVQGLNGRDHELYIARLYDRIVPGDSCAKVKRDQVVLMLRKAACSTWSYVTEQERRAVEKKAQQQQQKRPKPGEEEDPNAGLMSLMRQMYEDGDDEMKRTIAKAWTESQSKRAAGE